MSGGTREFLYVAQGFAGSTTLDRRNALERLGVRLHHLKTDPWMRHPNIWWLRWHHRTGMGPLVGQFNRAILDAAADRPRCVWIDKGIWVRSETLRTLQAAGASLVHYTPDVGTTVFSTRNFRRCLPLYDLVVTTKEREVEAYRALGARNVLCVMQGVDAQRLQASPDALARFPASDVVFIGRSEPAYVSFLRRYIELLPEVNVKIWGYWDRAARRYPGIARCWGGGPAYGEAYACALRTAKIGLGLLSHVMGDTETTRSFEIPAAGTLLLAGRSDSHLRLYREGVEAEFFADVEEAAAKTRALLADDARRKSIAAAGHRRLVDDDYSVDRYIGEVLREMQRLGLSGIPAQNAI